MYAAVFRDSGFCWTTVSVGEQTLSFFELLLVNLAAGKAFVKDVEGPVRS